jgi:hypothetical protein
MRRIAFGVVAFLLPFGCESEVEIRRETPREDVLSATVTRSWDRSYKVGAVGLANMEVAEARPLGNAGLCAIVERVRDEQASEEEEERAQPVEGAFIDVEVGGEVHIFDLSHPDAYNYMVTSDERLFVAGDLITFRTRGDDVPALERTVTAIDIPAVVLPARDDDGEVRLKRDEAFSITWDPATDAGAVELTINAPMETFVVGNSRTDGPVHRTIHCEADASTGILTVDSELLELMPKTQWASLLVVAGRQWTDEVEGWRVRFYVGGTVTEAGRENSTGLVDPLIIE